MPDVMADEKTVERIPKAIICLQSSVELWKLLRQALDAGKNGAEFVFAQSPEGAADLVGVCRRLSPALLIVEHNQIESIPLKSLRDLISRRDLQIVVFSNHSDEATFDHFFQIGCTGVLPHAAAPQVIAKAIAAICAGEFWFPRKILSKLAHEAFMRSTTRKITQRESEIFKLVCLGFTNQQIAEHLFISRETVRWHLRSLYSKIGVESRTGAIRYAKYGNAGKDPEEPPEKEPRIQAM